MLDEHHVTVWYLWCSESGTGSPGTKEMDGYEPLDGSWGLKLRSSVRATSALKHGANSPASTITF